MIAAQIGVECFASEFPAQHFLDEHALSCRQRRMLAFAHQTMRAAIPRQRRFLQCLELERPLAGIDPEEAEKLERALLLIDKLFEVEDALLGFTQSLEGGDVVRV